MKLGEVLADMVRYGDIEEAPFPDEWLKLIEKEEGGFQAFYKNDPELYTRLCIAASLLRLTNGTQGGSWSMDEKVVKPFLQQEVSND